ncbi:unnamed protein product [Colletotrichum noveboracense]|uniref:Uncharacterized protein n=1 Tax=Colletotrichum noveboracense TaxID=2664923 RepID=A0A9W4S0Q5_9PEZI|nr:unnamed protein product [Colletotrichum noveboracense]
MQPHATLILIAVQAAAAADQFWTGREIDMGPFGSDPFFNNNQSDQIYREAITNPKAMRSVKFVPFSGLISPKVYGRDPYWTWRVNVTEFAFPSGINVTDAVTGAEQPVENPSYVSTTWDFAWSSGGNISQALGNSTGPLCVSILDIVAYPANVTNLYTDENTNSTDCTPILGEACVRAILTEGSNFSRGTTCNEPKKLWGTLPECNNTIGYAVEKRLDFKLFNGTFGGGVATANLNPDPSNSPNASSSAERNRTFGITSRKGFMGLHSGVIPGANATDIYLAATNSLQLLMISHGFGNSSLGETQLHCMRANTTQLPVDENENGGGQENDATRIQYHVAWTLMIVVLTVLLARST